MGLLSRRGRGVDRDCDCRLCRPGDESDPQDAKAVADVRDPGVHVLLVSDDGACGCDHEHEPTDEPDFAYTVGLWHHRRHPELLVSGLTRMSVMHHALNALASRVLEDGERLEPGRLYEDALGGVPVTVEEMTVDAADQHATWARWFHRRPVPVLQVVWPDLEGVFAWQGGDDTDDAQPPHWRLPGPREGALAPEPSWPFPVPPDTLVLSCRHVVDDRDPVRYVEHATHDDGREIWALVCDGETDHDDDQLVHWHLSHAVAGSPSLRELADLPLQSAAERKDLRSPWVRSS